MVGGKGKNLRLEFKIGRDRFYILKDLTAFVKAIEMGALAEYGKNLAFHHSLEAFVPGSRLLAEFIIETVHTFQGYYSQFRKTAYETRPILRELTVNK